MSETYTFYGRNNKLLVYNADKGDYVETIEKIPGLHINIHGDNNEIKIADPTIIESLYVTMWGNGHKFSIGKGWKTEYTSEVPKPIKGLTIDFHHNDCECIIGENCFFNYDCYIALLEPGCRCHIGNSVKVATYTRIFATDAHPIIDIETGRITNWNNGKRILTIGDHCWIGQRAFIAKNTVLPDYTIVGAQSVVSGRFKDSYTVIAGNPAKVVKRGVKRLDIWPSKEELEKMILNDIPVPKIQKLGPLYKKTIKYDSKGKKEKKVYVLGGACYYKSNKFGRSLSFCGIPFWRKDKDKIRILCFTVYKSPWKQDWLKALNQQIPAEYDDIYLIRHNIGETYIELLYLKDRIKANQSKKPLLVVWNDKYMGMYKMFVPDTVDIKYIPLNKDDLHAVFAGTKTDYKDIVLTQGEHRFFCSTPGIVENMLRTEEITRTPANFWDYILDACKIPKHSPPAILSIPTATQDKVDNIITKIKLQKPFVILAPETNSLTELPLEFWQDITDAFCAKNYDVFVNTSINNCRINHAKACSLSIDELVCLATKAQKIITMGSGLAVLLTATGTPMDIIYTEFQSGFLGCNAKKVIDLYSVFHIPCTPKGHIVEYDAEKLTLIELKNQIIREA